MHGSLSEQALSMHCTRVPVSQRDQKLNKQPRGTQSHHSSSRSDPLQDDRQVEPSLLQLHEFSIPQRSEQPLTRSPTKYLVVAIHASIQEDVDHSFVTVPGCQVQGSVFLSVAA